ncbi:MAG: restriction endonuclease [Thaumarchaeota archaeon]|nr:restriction endonuclease [Candidatus Geocrenenecus arthurdayi]
MLTTYFIGREKEAKLAFEAGSTFIEKLLEYENVPNPDKGREILWKIEDEFYNEFLKAFKKYLRLDRIPDRYYREKIRDTLLHINSKLYNEGLLTPNGTFIITRKKLIKELKTILETGDKEIWKIISYSINSGLIVKISSLDDYIFPAPCLSSEIIELITKSISEMESFSLPPPRLEHFEVEPSREVLEGIVASVFKDLGFEVSTNVKKETRRGNPIEVDVWAQKEVIGSRFSIYVSCKNQPIDRSVINEEIGRVLNLRELPQLKVIISEKLWRSAREMAEANGFLIIELKRKAETKNARDIYEFLYRTFIKLFSSST